MGCCASVTLPAAPCPHQHAACRLFPLQRAWEFLGLGPFPSSIPCRERQTRRDATVHRYKCTMPLYSPRRPSYTVNAPTSPYSRPHEPKHSPASFKSSTSTRLGLRDPQIQSSSLSDSSTLLERKTSRPTPNPFLESAQAQRERSHLRHHRTQPRIQQPQPSAPGGFHSIWHIWRLKFQACQLSTAA